MEIQDDEGWKRIQLNTFTRWVRQKLEQMDVTMSDLESDFEDGLKLIRLIEVLSGKSFGRHNKKVTFRHQKLENISLALQFLEKEEKIKLINIDSSAIADHNVKLILGLVWKLILHYSISKQLWDQSFGESENVDISGKEKLLKWLRARLPAELSVTNFTSNWNDGIRLGALVHSCAPELEVGWQKWLPSQALQSTTTAIRLARDYLGVAPLIEPEELISPAVDEKSVMTYLSQFPAAKYTQSLGQLHVPLLKPKVGIRTVFKLQTRDALVVPEIIIKGPDGSLVPHAQNQISETVYEFEYQPEIPGEYEITAKVRDMECGDSADLPKTKVVAVGETNVSSVSIDGLRSETVIVGERKDFVVDLGNLTPKCNSVVVTAEEVGEAGPKHLISLEQEANSNIYRGCWTTKKSGETKICVFLDGNPVHECIYNAVQQNEYITAFGEGLEKAVVDVPAKFMVDLKDAAKGQVEVVVSGPSEAKVDVSNESIGQYSVEYITETPGQYEITVYYDERRKQIPGSPFMVISDYPRDASKIVIAGCSSDQAQVGIPYSFLIDASRTEQDTVGARLADCFEQPIVEEIIPRLYRCTFLPVSTPSGTMELELLYGGQRAGRPLSFSILRDDGIKPVEMKTRGGEPLPKMVEACSNFEAVIDISKIEGEIYELHAEIKGPDNRLRKLLLTKSSGKIYFLDFIPTLAGRYFIIIHVNWKPASAPHNFTAIPVGSAEQCFIESAPVEKFWIVGDQKTVTINAKNGGGGSLNILCNKLDLSTNTEYDDGIYTVTLAPRSRGFHQVAIMYGGVEIPGGSILFESVSPFAGKQNGFKTAMGTDSDFSPCNFSFSFNSEYELDKLTAIVKTPSGQRNKAHIYKNEDGSVQVAYQPKECGIHLLKMKHDGNTISESIRSFEVNEEPHHASASGSGLTYGFAGEPASFTICAKQSATRLFSISIEGPAKSYVKCHDNRDGTCSVVWTPTAAGIHKINIMLCGKPLSNSPYTVIVSDEKQQDSYLTFESLKPLEVVVNVEKAEIDELSVTVESWDGEDEPCTVRQIDADHIGVTFTPCGMGQHVITVKKDEEIIATTSYVATEGAVNNDNAAKVIVGGTGIENAICQEKNNLAVDISNAGTGVLSLLMRGPSKVVMKCVENENGLLGIVYAPTEPGIYTLSVIFSGISVPGSPFTISCTGDGLRNLMESVIVDLKQVCTLPKRRTLVYFLLENIRLENTEVLIIGPNDRYVDGEIRKVDHSLYQVEFKPVVVGPHILSIFEGGKHVPGSPYLYTVGHLTELGAHKVRAEGTGLKRAEVKRKKCINIYTREAGEGELEAIMQGPSKADMLFHAHEDGNCHLDYRVMKPGKYILSIKFNAEHIPDSPFKVFVAPDAGQVRRLQLKSLSDPGTPGVMCSFVINKNGAEGELKAELHTPSHKVYVIEVLPTAENDLYCGSFTPFELGDHYVDVMLDGASMINSPFPFRIGTNANCDPSLVKVIGNCIPGGRAGRLSKFMINTCDAGVGVLDVQISGPSKSVLNACDVERGYKVFYIPPVPGPYYAAIKYSGVHIPGSPFKMIVTGREYGRSIPATTAIKLNTLPKATRQTVPCYPYLSGNAKKVIVRGVGLSKFTPGQTATFNIDTNFAGHNVLYIGLLTSTGSCEQVTWNHVGNGLYVASYVIQEEVKGFLYIKYGEEDVPGSPFTVSVL